MFSCTCKCSLVSYYVVTDERQIAYFFVQAYALHNTTIRDLHELRSLDRVGYCVLNHGRGIGNNELLY